MDYILCLETSGTNCSVAITCAETLIASKELNTGGFSHAENLHVFIELLLKETAIPHTCFKAIAVSSGPGSYTGLRIGVATAKGLCFAWNIPLIAIPTLEILAQNIENTNKIIVPMLDARRMEVYSCVFDTSYKEIRPTQAQIIDENSFSDYLSHNQVIFLGDGSAKFAQICSHPNAFFVENQFPTAIKMGKLAFDRYKQQQLEDIAYFEPFYLKSFMSNSFQNKQKINYSI